MRLAARVDSNQKAIVEALRACGASVLSLAQIGKGCPDLLVALPNGRTCLVEVKDGDKPPSQQQLTPHQVKFHAAWKGAIVIVNSVDHVFKIFSPKEQKSE
jgi:hypothetical protein